MTPDRFCMNDWHPIATAPKDGTWILVARGESRWIARWAKARYANFEGWQETSEYGFFSDGVTHWMSLPDLPVRPKAEG